MRAAAIADGVDRLASDWPSPWGPPRPPGMAISSNLTAAALAQDTPVVE
jgi:hypothetical protein